MTPELRDLEFDLVCKIRRGRDECWSQLLEIYEPRIAQLAARWGYDESDVYTIVIKKLQYAVENYRSGAASVWGFVRQLVDRALIDHGRRSETKRKTYLGDIDHEEHGYGGFLEVNPTEAVDFIADWIRPHRDLCAELIYKTAKPEVSWCFREFLRFRRVQRRLTKKSMLNVLGEFDLPDHHGRPITQASLFVDGFGSTLVDDYCLLGERIIREVANGTNYAMIGGKIGEPQTLVNRFKQHFKCVSICVVGDDEYKIH